MDSKEAIIQAAIALIREKGEQIDAITVREICKRAHVGLGLVNYHFGNKDKLIEVCVERIIGGIVDTFHSIQDKTEGLAPLEKLEHFGNMTLDFLFEHDAVSKISILADMNAPREDDNTYRTYLAFRPLVAACRPDWDTAKLERKTFCLIAAMQQAFLRRDMILLLYGMDLADPEARRGFHSRLLRDILEG